MKFNKCFQCYLSVLFNLRTYNINMYSKNIINYKYELVLFSLINFNFNIKNCSKYILKYINLLLLLFFKKKYLNIIQVSILIVL